jgi:hypothetical protein
MVSRSAVAKNNQLGAEALAVYREPLQDKPLMRSKVMSLPLVSKGLSNGWACGSSIERARAGGRLAAGHRLTCGGAYTGMQWVGICTCSGRQGEEAAGVENAPELVGAPPTAAAPLPPWPPGSAPGPSAVLRRSAASMCSVVTKSARAYEPGRWWV